MKVAVVLGGRSTERGVSLTSGAGMIAALESARADVTEVTRVHWREDGDFEIGALRCTPGEALAHLARFDACLLALHGGDGENGTLQGWLEMAGVAYSGSGVAASVLGMDKHNTRLLATSLGIRVAPGALVRAAGDGRAAETAVPADVLASARAGFFVKDRFGGSSLGTSFCATADALPSAIARAFESANDLVVEAKIVGTEVTAAVVDGDSSDREAVAPVAWPIVEVAPAAGAYFDYEQKYSASGAREFCPPRSLSADRQREVQAAARRLYEGLGCRGVARIDFIVPESAAQAPVLLEANTLPGMTPRSLVPLAAAQVGLDYPALCVYLARMAQARRVGAARLGGRARSAQPQG